MRNYWQYVSVQVLINMIYYGHNKRERGRNTPSRVHRLRRYDQTQKFNSGEKIADTLVGGGYFFVFFVTATIATMSDPRRIAMCNVWYNDMASPPFEGFGHEPPHGSLTLSILHIRTK